MTVKISEIQPKNLADYLRLEDDQYADTELQLMLDAAVTFMQSYTGLTLEELDRHEDLAIVVYVLVQDMFENRSYYVDNGNLNKVIETILGMYRTNLLPKAVTL